MTTWLSVALLLASCWLIACGVFGVYSCQMSAQADRRRERKP